MFRSDHPSNYKREGELNHDALPSKFSFLTVLIVDFNDKQQNWHSTDKTSFEESQTEFLASQFYDSGYHKSN